MSNPDLVNPTSN